MENEAGAGKRRVKRATPWQRRRRRAMLIALPLLAIIGAWFFWRVGKQAALNEAKRSASELGLPLTVADYEARYGPYESYWDGGTPLPPESPYFNVVKSFVLAPYEISQDLPNFRNRNENGDLDAVPYPAPTLTAMETFVTSNEAAFAALHETLRAGNKSSMSGLHRENLIELLCMEVCVRAHHGNATGVFEVIEDGLILLRDGDVEMGPEATPIGYTKELGNLFKAFESALRRVRLSGEQLLVLRSHLDSGDWLARVREESIHQQSSSAIDLESRGLDTEWVVMNLVTGFFDQYQAIDLQAWCIRQELMGKPRTAQTTIIEGYRGEGVHDYLRVFGPPVFVEVARTALDLLRYEGVEGHLPTGLDELVPAYRPDVPMDFWGDGPLQYRRDGRDFSVYSLDNNGNDDGGDRRSDTTFKTALPTPP